MASEGYAQTSSSEAINIFTPFKNSYEIGAMVAACKKANGKWPVTDSDIASCSAKIKDVKYVVKKYCELNVRPNSETEAILKVSLSFRKNNSVYCAKPISLSINMEGNKVNIVFLDLRDSQPRNHVDEDKRKQIDALENKLKIKLEGESNEISSER